MTAFAKATGDFSAIHMDAEFARLSRFRQRVVHGMLPVFCLLAQTGRDVAEINGRFSGPVYIDDSLEMSLSASDAGGWQAFRIECRARGTVATSGKVRLVTRASVPAGLETGILAGGVEQAEHELTALSVGQTETLHIVPDAKALTGVLALAFGPLSISAITPTLLALLPLSTVVGMRLPGRHATFSEFSARFMLPLMRIEAITLQATIAKIQVASRRIQLDIKWSQGGQPQGEGLAVTLVNAQAPKTVSCKEIRAHHMDFGLQAKVALVTGASRGIGAATAKLLALHGAVVAVHYHLGQADAQAVVADIEAAGARAFAVGADLRDAVQVAAMFAKVVAKAGPVDILVNNAVGEFSPKAFEAVTAQDLQAELDVSVLGMHACCREAVPGMRERGAGKIVNLGTVASHMPVAGQIRYITAKSAVEGYTRALAAELSAENIQVNLVVPAMTQTSLLASLPNSLVGRMAEENPQGRLLLPIEVAQAIVILCSDWTSASSGQQWILNQGMPPFF